MARALIYLSHPQPVSVLENKRRRRLLISAQGCARQSATLGIEPPFVCNSERVAEVCFSSAGEFANSFRVHFGSVRLFSQGDALGWNLLTPSAFKSEGEFVKYINTVAKLHDRHQIPSTANTGSGSALNTLALPPSTNWRCHNSNINRDQRPIE